MDVLLSLIGSDKPKRHHKRTTDEEVATAGYDGDDNGENASDGGQPPAAGGGVRRRAGEASSKRAPRLNRPIICICNDQYAPALRKLRKTALVFRFERPSTERLAARLAEICRQESLACDMQTLVALCEHAENDIRSCLNTLQFIRRKTTRLTSAMLSTMLVGHKDVGKSLYQLWEQIFQKPRRSRLSSWQQLVLHDSSTSTTPADGTRKSLRDRFLLHFTHLSLLTCYCLACTIVLVGLFAIFLYSGRAFTSTNSTVPMTSDLRIEAQHSRWLFDAIHAHGDIERIIQGCHENLLSVRYLDPMLTKVRVRVCAGHDIEPLTDEHATRRQTLSNGSSSPTRFKCWRNARNTLSCWRTFPLSRSRSTSSSAPMHSRKSRFRPYKPRHAYERSLLQWNADSDSRCLLDCVCLLSVGERHSEEHQHCPVVSALCSARGLCHHDLALGHRTRFAILGHDS